MNYIQNKLYEELDYKLEYSNQKLVYDLWFGHENIKVPQLIPELCTEKLLGMYYIDAENITTFVEDSTQEQRNMIGYFIVEFIFTNLYKNGIFYADIHYGNFLIKNKEILYVTDFGCINMVEDDLKHNLISLHKNMMTDDKETFFQIMKNMEILKDDISDESKNYMYDYFKLQYTPWIEEDFEFTEEWIEKSVYKDPELMKEWILPSNCVYLNKIPYGLYHILTKLKLNVNFLDFFDQFLSEKIE